MVASPQRVRSARRPPHAPVRASRANEFLRRLTLSQKWDLAADEVARNICAHPTVSGGVKESVEGITGHMIDF